MSINHDNAANEQQNDAAPAVPPPAHDTSSNVLKVAADPKDIAPEKRAEAVKKLAGAIAHYMRQHGEVNIRCFGSAAVYKACKAMAIARGYLAVQGFDLYFVPAFITTDMDGVEKTGLAFIAVSSKTEPQKQ